MVVSFEGCDNEFNWCRDATQEKGQILISNLIVFVTNEKNHIIESSDMVLYVCRLNLSFLANIYLDICSLLGIVLITQAIDFY